CNQLCGNTVRSRARYASVLLGVSALSETAVDALSATATDAVPLPSVRTKTAGNSSAARNWPSRASARRRGLQPSNPRCPEPTRLFCILETLHKISMATDRLTLHRFLLEFKFANVQSIVN